MIRTQASRSRAWYARQYAHAYLHWYSYLYINLHTD